MNVVTKVMGCSRCKGKGTHDLISEDKYGCFMDEVEYSFCLGHGEVLKNKTTEDDTPNLLTEATAHRHSFEEENRFLT